MVNCGTITSIILDHSIQKVAVAAFAISWGSPALGSLCLGSGNLRLLLLNLCFRGNITLVSGSGSLFSRRKKWVPFTSGSFVVINYDRAG